MHYIPIIRARFISSMAYRFNYLFPLFGNFIYVIIIFFLWKAVFASSSGQIGGMNFNETFLYVSVASCISFLFQTSSEWMMAQKVRTGSIISDLVKPLNFSYLTLSSVIGLILSNLITITFPSALVILLFFHNGIHIGLHLIIFVFSLILAVLIAFYIDFFIGTLSFYTESIWGISIAKDVIVRLLSGAIIPLSFFPESINSILIYLPFQGIYNAPLTILIGESKTFKYYLSTLGMQTGWVIILFLFCTLFYNKAIKKITLNGG